MSDREDEIFTMGVTAQILRRLLGGTVSYCTGAPGSVTYMVTLTQAQAENIITACDGLDAFMRAARAYARQEIGSDG